MPPFLLILPVYRPYLKGRNNGFMAKFLVVEDEPDACKALADLLTQSGVAVRACENGTEAIEVCRKERVDLVFCDLKLPGLDGLAVLEAIKRIDPWATIIVVTAYGSVDSATHALRLGAYDFIEKPFTPAQIQQVARRAMDHRHTLAQLARCGNSGLRLSCSVKNWPWRGKVSTAPGAPLSSSSSTGWTACRTCS
jgi:DNA-binding NtrC family response regulator